MKGDMILNKERRYEKWGEGKGRGRMKEDVSPGRGRELGKRRERDERRKS